MKQLRRKRKMEMYDVELKMWVIGIIAFFVILLVPIVITINSPNNIIRIDGFPCYKNIFSMDDYPLCKDLRGCRNKCEMLQGDYVKVAYLERRGSGWYTCYCLVDNKITGIRRQQN